ncbi:alpha/beta fold hydrolase [Sinomonas sp. JGH33]|uniref:Alpha/beta fold hydrolase n=1 Tax=Sinomonas terricola TaxID=3110330 RepID=A0ABU5TB09_9MICC|nr:alpha/beta fold hydrolase [Sinomonas sp. JGH33]MEA5456868.1 alpha/beta fold hydrolase [Sinomonas sp. JGH33]
MVVHAETPGPRWGVAMCHGFSGTPSSVAPWAEGLAARGFDVEVPLLPGHGTDWEDLESRRWREWADCFEAACERVAARTDFLFVAGLSMGGAIALRAASRLPVAGVAVVNPGLGFYDWRVRYIRAIRLVQRTTDPIDEPDAPAPVGDEGDYTRTPLAAVHELKLLFAAAERSLPRVKAPLIAFKSDVDPVVPPSSIRRILARAGSHEIDFVPLHASAHVATRDVEAPLIVERTAEFFERCAAQSTERAVGA